MIFWLSWILTAGTVSGIYLAGNKNKNGWLIGITMQIPWAIFDILTGAYGLLPLGFILSTIYFRNYLKWKKL